MKFLVLPALGLALGATTAHAQSESAPPASAAEATPADAPPPAAEAPTAAASYTSEDIDTFAAVTLKLQAINADASLDAPKKQEAMRAAASEGGLDAAKYNAIARAAEADTELREKILAAVAAKRGGDAGPSDR